MVAERWSADDSQERRDRIGDADKRLEAWATWSRRQNPIGGASSSNWFMALNPAQAEEAQAGAKHVASCVSDEEAMQVDAVIARWSLEERWYWKIARREYLYHGPHEKKAADLGVSKGFYRTLLDELRVVMWRELDTLARKRIRVGRLADVSAKSART